MDHEAFQTDSQTTLIAVCFVSPPTLHSRYYVKHLRSVFKTNNSSYWLLDTRGTVHCFQAFIHPPFDLSSHLWSRMCSALQSPLVWTEQRISFMVFFFHSCDGFWELIGYQAHLSASVSSVSLFSFLFSVESSSLSGAPHMLCVTSCGVNNSPIIPGRQDCHCQRSILHTLTGLMHDEACHANILLP